MKSNDKFILGNAIDDLNKVFSFPNILPKTKAMAFRQLSRAYRKIGNNEKAVEYAEEAIKGEPNLWGSYIVKAIALRHLGKIDDAIKILEDVTQKNDKHELAYYNLACYYAEKFKYASDLQEKKAFKEKVLFNLGEAIELKATNKREARIDKDFVSMKDEEEYKRLTQRLIPKNPYETA